MGGKQMSNKRRNQNPLLSTFRWSFTLNIFPFSLSEFWCSDRKSRFNGSSSFFSSRQQVCHWRGNLCSAAPKELLWSKTGYKPVLSSTPGRDRLPRERGQCFVISTAIKLPREAHLCIGPQIKSSATHFTEGYSVTHKVADWICVIVEGGKANMED